MRSGAFEKATPADGATVRPRPLRDVQRTVLGTTYAHVFREGSVAYAGVHGGREEPDAAGVDYLGHRLVGDRTLAAGPFCTGSRDRRDAGPIRLIALCHALPLIFRAKA